MVRASSLLRMTPKNSARTVRIGAAPGPIRQCTMTSVVRARIPVLPASVPSRQHRNGNASREAASTVEGTSTRTAGQRTNSALRRDHQDTHYQLRPSALARRRQRKFGGIARRLRSYNVSVRRLIWAWLSFAGWAVAQQYPFVAVKAPNPPQGVKGLFQDHIGRLWVRTTSDVACFDGSRFFYLRNYGFPDTEARSIAEDDDGAIWIGSSLGLHRFWKGKLVRIQEGVVPSVVRGAPGIILAAIGPPGKGLPGAADLYRIHREGSVWRSEKLPDLQVVGTLSIGHDQSITFAGQHSWFETSAEATTNWKAGTRLQTTDRTLPGMNVEQVFRDQFGCVWLRNQGATAYQCPSDQQLHHLPDSITDGQKLISETSDGRILLPGQGSFALGRPGSFHVAKPANGLPAIEAALMAADGSLWIGGSKGLFRFAYPFSFEFWTERDGLGDVTSTIRVRDRVFAADRDGIKELSRDRRSWSLLPKLADLGRVYHMIPGPADTIFASLYYHGVEQISLDGTAVIRPTHDIPGMHLAETGDGSLWLAGIGVSRVVVANGQAKLVEEPLPARHWNGLDIETNPSNGDLWACYDGGLIKKEISGWVSITEKDGLLQNGCRSIAVSPNGDVWYGYNSIAAFTLVKPRPNAPPQLRHFRPGGDVGDAVVHFLDFDRRGWLWRGAGDGVYVATPEAAENGAWLHLGDDDGLPGLDMNQQALYADADGSVWFGADTSLTHFAPPSNLLEPLSTNAFISAFSWDGGTPRFAETIDSVPSGAKLTAHVGSLQFDRRNGLRVRYRMLPDQAAWKDSSSLDLPLGTAGWGAHTLEVQARIGAGPWSPTAAYSFSVVRPVGLSWPVLGMVVPVLLAAIFWVRVRSLKRTRRERKALPDLTALRMAAMVPESQVLLGTTLDGRFTPRRFLARGGFASVFDGHDQLQDRRCAIKVFHREVADLGLVRRFQREVAALETIVHPNVVRLYGHGNTQSGVPYLVMEFIEGTTLRDALPSGGFEPRQVASLLRQAGSALEAIHRLGIYHRDLKPENLMIRLESSHRNRAESGRIHARSLSRRRNLSVYGSGAGSRICRRGKRRLQPCEGHHRDDHR